jgi:hypothetical protein
VGHSIPAGSGSRPSWACRLLLLLSARARGVHSSWWLWNATRSPLHAPYQQHPENDSYLSTPAGSPQQQQKVGTPCICCDKPANRGAAAAQAAPVKAATAAIMSEGHSRLITSRVPDNPLSKAQLTDSAARKYSAATAAAGEASMSTTGSSSDAGMVAARKSVLARQVGVVWCGVAGIAPCEHIMTVLCPRSDISALQGFSATEPLENLQELDGCGPLF